MGYKDWRERQIQRVDEMTARADERARAASDRAAELKVEQVAAREQQGVDVRDEWMRRRAAQLREDHDDLVSRAEAVGMGLPVSERRRRGGALGALGELVVRDGSGAGGGRIDAYEGWRDRIVVEESMAAKEARGEQLSRWDKLALKTARLSSK